MTVTSNDKMKIVQLLYFVLSVYLVPPSETRPVTSTKDQKIWQACYGIFHVETSFAFCSLSYSHSDGSDCKNYQPSCENPCNVCENAVPLGASGYTLRDDNCWMGSWATPPCRDYQVDCTTFIPMQTMFWSIKPFCATVFFLALSLVLLSQTFLWVRKLKKEQGCTWTEVMLPEILRNFY